MEWVLSLASETCGGSHYALYVALACMSAGLPLSKPSLRKGLHFSLCSSCQHVSLLVLAAGWGWGRGMGKNKGTRIFMLFDEPTELRLGFRLTLQTGGIFPGSGNIMCSVGWAKEDPGRWSMTWYGTRYLFVKVFCLQNKCGQQQWIFFNIHLLCCASLGNLTWEESSPYRKREGTVSVFCLSFCCLQQQGH